MPAAVLAFPLLLAAMSPSPAPSPAPLRTIESLHVTPFCAALREAIPAYLGATERNEARFAAIDEHARAMSEWIAAGFTDGPALTLDAANIDQLDAQAVADIAGADLALRHSYERTPQGTDPALDDVRRRMQTVIDLERVLTDRFASLTWAAQAGPKMTSFRFEQNVEREVARDSTEESGAGSHAPIAPATLERLELGALQRVMDASRRCSLR